MHQIVKEIRGGGYQELKELAVCRKLWELKSIHPRRSRIEEQRRWKIILWLKVNNGALLFILKLHLHVCRHNVCLHQVFSNKFNCDESFSFQKVYIKWKYPILFPTWTAAVARRTQDVFALLKELLQFQL